MVEGQATRSWLQWLLSAQVSDLNVRNWVLNRRSQVHENLRASLKKKGGLAAAVFSPLLEVDSNKASYSEHFEQAKFHTRAHIGETIFRSCIHLARQWIGASVHELDLKAGRLRYWKTGNQNAETILYFHGFGDSMDGIYPFALHLTKHFNLVVPDLPGFGQSFKRKDLPHNYESYAEWIAEFAEAAALGPVHVVGNSLGGAFAMMFAQKRPDLVQSLTLINSAAITDFKNPSIYDEFLAGEIMFQVKTVEEFDRFWRRVFHRPPVLPPFVKDYLLRNFRENHEWYGHLIKQMFADIPGKNHPRYKDLFMNQHMAKIKVPTLIIWGDRDSLFPLSFGQRGHKLLRNSRMVVLEGVGHAPQVEVPGLVARHLREFIGSLEPAVAS